MRNQNSPVVGVTSTPRKFSAVTFRQFSELARRRNWTAQQLAARFRGRIDNPSEFFSRVLSGKSPDAVIPYRSVIEIWARAQESAEPEDQPNPAGKVRQTAVNDFLDYV